MWASQKKLTDELMRALMEANERGAIDDGGIEGSPTSFSDLVKDVTSQRQDLKAFALKTKAMVHMLNFNGH